MFVIHRLTVDKCHMGLPMLDRAFANSWNWTRQCYKLFLVSCST